MVQGFKQIRLKFSKLSNAKFISHLDLDRTMKSAIKRAGLTVEYSHGYNPRPKLRFSLPLSVGTESICEFLDINISDGTEIGEVGQKLNEKLPDNISIVSCYEPKTDFSQIKWAKYEIKLISPSLDSEMCDRLRHLFEHEVIINKRTKKTKSGYMDFDISPYVKSFAVDETGCGATVSTVLSASGENYINPDYILQAMEKYLNLTFTNPLTDLYSPCRTGIYTENGEEFE